MTLRDRLRSRQLPQATVGIRLDWSEESYTLHRLAETAEEQARQAAVLGSDALTEIQAMAAEARATVDALYEHVTVKALPAHEYEALVAAHPATEDQAAEKSYTFNPETFWPALLAACVEGPESEDDWAQMMKSGELMNGEVNALIGAAMDLNNRVPDVSLGKGSTTTSS